MASRSFKRYVEQELGKFPHFVIYAILEWLLIMLLFIDGFLAFISNEFAKFFELKIPCLLCTRIDHVLVHRNSNFYSNDSICEVHKRDISSLGYCHVHQKLSDLRNMCEGCLLSFATEKGSDTSTYKSLVRILNKDIDSFMENDHGINLKTQGGRKEEVEKNGVQRCSCCGEPLKMRPCSKNVTRISSYNGRVLSQVPVLSPRAPPGVTRKNEDSRNLELPHIPYTELKFMSDTESELPDDEEGSNLDIQPFREDNKTASMPLLPGPEDISEDARTPSFIKGSKFFGIPLTDSAFSSPRWASRFPKKLQLEKAELFLDSNDTNAKKEVEGDSILHLLKRQVRLDRKSLITLYMELDEERSASAVAANNAMAMITRLQAEKAAVQMEALQYQRMMEEQAEYDQEAIQVMKDLLSKREEDIKVLEAELETYRERYGHINRVCNDECEVDADEYYQELKSHSFSSISERSDCGSPCGERILYRSSLDFEGERNYLLGLLTNLEKKISMASSNDGIMSLKDEHAVAGNEKKIILTSEVSVIRERLRAIEADSGFQKHAAMTLQKGSEGTNFN